jgi:hypothetical protein
MGHPEWRSSGQTTAAVITRQHNTSGGNDRQPPHSDTVMESSREEYSMGQFAGKVALITGGNAGIGRATAVAFAKQGATVVVSARREKEGLDVIAEINALGGKAIFVKADVSQESDVKAMVEQTLATFGRLDYAFNNAGIEQDLTPLPDQTEATYDRIMDVNVKGVWLSLKHEMPAMLQTGGGAIVSARHRWMGNLGPDGADGHCAPAVVTIWRRLSAYRRLSTYRRHQPTAYWSPTYSINPSPCT